MNIVELNNRAMLVSLTIPTVQSVTTVKDTTRRVVAEENASRAAVRVVAAKLPVARAAAVQSKLDEVRSLHTALTLPFIGQFRLLRAETYLDYLAKVQQALDAASMQVLVQFGPRHEVLADIAKQMGDISYDVGQIPTADQLTLRVKTAPVFLPISSLFDIEMQSKLGVDKDELQKMNTAQTHAIQRVAVSATIDVVDEVIGAVSRVALSLQKYDEEKPEFNADGKRTRRSGFHATMITNLIDLADRLPALDLTTEGRLTAISGPVRQLARYDTDTLKDNATARHEILQEATDLLASLTGVVPTEDFGDDEMFGGLL
jgi:hypothetical protein